MKYPLSFFILFVLVVGCTQTNDIETPSQTIPPTAQNLSTEEQPISTPTSQQVNATINETTPINETIPVPVPIEVPLENSSQTTPPPVQQNDTVTPPIIYPQITYSGAYNGPLFDTSVQAASSAPMELFFTNMDRNGVSFALMFFSVEPASLTIPLNSVTGIGKIAAEVKKHPYRIIPFYSRGTGGEETNALIGDELTYGYEATIKTVKSNISQSLLKGIGELEHYAWSVPVDDQDLLKLYDVAKEHNLTIMIHPKQGSYASLESVLKRYPNTTFIIHAFPEDFDEDTSDLEDLLDTFPNVYFGVEADHMMYYKGWGLLYKFEEDGNSAAANFVDLFDEKETTILSSAKSRYYSLIKKYPTRFMWGTEMGLRYNHEPEVYDRTIKFSRRFIGGLPTNIQEDFAYKNALRILGSGLTFDENITILEVDTTKRGKGSKDQLVVCGDSEIDSCDDSCGIEESGEYQPLSTEEENCFFSCIVNYYCVDLPEND